MEEPPVITIVDQFPNKYREIKYVPMNLKDRGLDEKTALQICDNIRIKLTSFFESEKTQGQIDYFQEVNRSSDVNGRDLVQTANLLHFPLILFQSAEQYQMGIAGGGHWTLLLEKPSKDREIVKVFDPVKETGESDEFISQEEYLSKAYPNEDAFALGDKYSLTIPDGTNDSLKNKIQVDDYNCGLMVLVNAMLRANELGYISEDSRKKIEDNFGLTMNYVPGLNTVKIE